MPYVHRDINGVIDATFSLLQPGFAEEYLADDDPEVIEFRNTLPFNSVTAAQVATSQARDKEAAMQLVRDGDLVGALQLLGVLPKE